MPTLARSLPVTWNPPARWHRGRAQPPGGAVSTATTPLRPHSSFRSVSRRPIRSLLGAEFLSGLCTSNSERKGGERLIFSWHLKPSGTSLGPTQLATSAWGLLTAVLTRLLLLSPSLSVATKCSREDSPGRPKGVLENIKCHRVPLFVFTDGCGVGPPHQRSSR